MTNHATVHHRRRVAALVVAAAACLSALAACGGDDEPSEAQGTTTSSTAPPESTAPPTTLTTEQEVEAAFHEFVAVMAELGPAPNPDDARLPQIVVEPQLSILRDGLRQRQATNQVFEIGSESRSEILNTGIDSTGVNATLLVCVVSADTKVDRDTGDVLSDAVYASTNEFAYRRENNKWMLADVTYVDSWEGATTCEG